MASFAAAFYDIAVSWKKADLANAPRSPLSAEATWTLAIQIIDAVHDAIENGEGPNLPVWQFSPRGSKDTLDPPADQRLDRDAPAQAPAADAGTGDTVPTDSGTPGDTADTADPADGGAAGRRVDDDPPKSEE